MKKLRNHFTTAELSWIFYDIGNSAFTMIAVSLIPIWFKSLAITGKPGGLTSDQATGTWALAISTVTVVLALLGPIIGAITDNRNFKKLIFTSVLAVGVIGCILCGITSSWLMFLIIFIFTKVAYSASVTFYDSMLVDVTTPERMDEISSYGFAWGYLGSCIPFLAALIFYVLDSMLHVMDAGLARFLGCFVVGVWWVVMTIPLLKNYKQKHFVPAQKHAIRASLLRVKETVTHIASKDKKVFYFLLAFFMYIDGVGTIIDNAINIGTDLGLNTVGQVVFLLATQVVAFAFSLLFAKLSKKHRTVNLISVCIIGYFCVCVYALTLKTLWQFGIMAFGVGMFQGSIQALSRSYFSKIIPPERSGEYFGIYDIFSKGASFLGSFVIAMVKYMGGSINVAVGSLVIFFILGFLLLKKADRTQSSFVSAGERHI